MAEDSRTTVRLPVSTHRKAKVASAVAGQSIQDWVASAIEDRIQSGTKAEPADPEGIVPLLGAAYYSGIPKFHDELKAVLNEWKKRAQKEPTNEKAAAKVPRRIVAG